MTVTHSTSASSMSRLAPSKLPEFSQPMNSPHGALYSLPSYISSLGKFGYLSRYDFLVMKNAGAIEPQMPPKR